MRSWLRVDAAPGRVPRWRSEGAFTVRVTGRDQVHVVSAAAGPIGGDEVVVEVRVGEGASLTVRGVAASVALPGAKARRSSWSCELNVAAGARLVLDPQPVIVAGRAEHRGRTSLRLAQDGSAVVVERAQIGRSGEAEGVWHGSFAADVAGQELLRHSAGLGEGSATWDRFFVAAALESEFSYPDDRPVWAGLPADLPSEVWAARLPLAGGGEPHHEALAPPPRSVTRRHVTRIMVVSANSFYRVRVVRKKDTSNDPT